MFLLLLRGPGAVRLRPALGSLIRVVIATGLAAGVVQWSGLGWQAGLGSVGLNLVRGCLIGGLIMGVFGLSVLVLWQTAGRPNGAEQRLIQLIGPRLMRVRLPGWARFSR